MMTAGRMTSDLAQDVRLAWRSLRRMRGAGLAAMAALALGIGAATTMLSVVDAAIVQQVPFDDPSALVVLYNTRITPRDGLQRLRWSKPQALALERAASSFETLATYSSTIGLAITDAGFAEPLDGEVVSPGYFPALRVRATAGRTFRTDEDTVAGAHPVVIISDRLWRRRFNADPGVINTTIHLNDVALTVVGVLPPGFIGLSTRSDVWIPTTMAPQLTYGDYLTTPQHFVSLIGRLKRGVDLARANAELAVIGPRFADAGSPATTTWGVEAVSMSVARGDPAARRSMLLLLAAALCVLLVASVNVASVLLARTSARRQEMAIRLALGSSRARLVRQLLTEGLVMAAVAGAAGAAPAVWGTTIYARTVPVTIGMTRMDFPSVTPFSSPAINPRLFMMVLAITLGTTVLCAMAPAALASRARPAAALGSGERTAAPRRRTLTGFVVTEIALAVLLLVGGGLLLESVARLEGLRAGYSPESILTFWVRPPAGRYAPADGPAILERLLAGIEAVPGVTSAALNRCVPFAGCSRTTIYFPDRANDPDRLPVVGRHYVSAGYASTLGIPLRAGRWLTSADRAGAASVAVINETAARRFWPGQDPIGRQVWFGPGTGFMDPAHPVTIVGVVGDVKYETSEQPVGPDFYTSYLQFSYPDSMVILKTIAPAEAIVPALRAAIGGVDRAIPMFDVQAAADRVDAATARPRFNATLVSAGAVTALLLVSLGVYGLLAYAVSTRTREMGIRLALGADRGRLIRLVIGEGVRLAAIGVAAGLALSIAAGRVLLSLVADAAACDPRLLAMAALILLVVAAAAAYFPAARAGAVNPVVTLTSD
jgi:putative ABC transport system permease protein